MPGRSFVSEARSRRAGPPGASRGTVGLIVDPMVIFCSGCGGRAKERSFRFFEPDEKMDGQVAARKQERNEHVPSALDRLFAVSQPCLLASKDLVDHR